MSIRDAIQGLRSEWRLMTLYERFGQLVALGGVAALGAAP